PVVRCLSASGQSDRRYQHRNATEFAFFHGVFLLMCPCRAKVKVAGCWWCSLFPPSVTSLGIQPAANDRKKSHRLVGQGAMPTEEPQRLHLFLLRGARTSQGPALRWLKNTKPVNLIWLVPAKEERSPQGLHPRVVV